MPILVQINRNRAPAKLIIRHGATSGSIHQVVGEVVLKSATGRALWGADYDGFEEDLSPSVFRFAFADADGIQEIFYRHAESNYDVKADGTRLHRSW